MPRQFMKHSSQAALHTWVWKWQLVMLRKVREKTGATVADQVREALTFYFNMQRDARVVTQDDLNAAKEGVSKGAGEEEVQSATARATAG